MVWNFLFALQLIKGNSGLLSLLDLSFVYVDIEFLCVLLVTLCRSPQISRTYLLYFWIYELSRIEILYETSTLSQYVLVMKPSWNYHDHNTRNTSISSYTDQCQYSKTQISSAFKLSTKPPCQISVTYPATSSDRSFAFNWTSTSACNEAAQTLFSSISIKSSISKVDTSNSDHV